ncbi:MAG: protein kinase [Verrucomicrobiia bacterium]
MGDRPARWVSPASGASLAAASSRRATAASLYPPPVIPDHQLLRIIGSGAYGQVWLARGVVGRLRAVKVVRHHEFEDERPSQREFKGLLEFEAISRSHPGLMQILHVGCNDGEGYLYYVMELADDTARNTAYAERRTEDGPERAEDGELRRIESYVPRTLLHDLRERGRLPAAECLEIARCLSAALRHLHEAGLVHRDIKPSNIIFVEGQAKLADVGLVTRSDATMSWVGTEGYIPPEGPGSARADLYALGKTLYQAATGLDRRCFPELPPDLGRWEDRKLFLALNEVIVKACAVEPKDRYRAAGELERDLERLREGRSLRWSRTLERTVRCGRKAAPAAVIGVALASAVWFWSRPVDRREAPGNVAPTTTLVLPFRTPEREGPAQQIAERVTDGLIDSLGIFAGKERIGPRKSGWLFKDQAEARRLAFEQPFVNQALEGMVTVGSNQVRVELSVYTRTPVAPVWTEQVAGSVQDLVALEWEVAETVARRMGLPMADVNRARVLNLLSNNGAALEWCRRGEEYVRVHSIERLTLAKKAFHKAKELDANCSRAIRGLLWVNRGMVYHRSHDDSWLEVRSYADDLLRIDDTDWYARYWKALARGVYEWKWSDGLSEFRAVMRERPNDEDYFCNMALLERALGRFEEARAYQAQQDAQLGTYDPFRWTSLLAKYVEARYAEVYERRLDTQPLYDAMIEGGRSCQKRAPESNYPHQIEALGHLGKRDYAAVIQTTRKGRTLYEAQELLGLEAYAEARRGEIDKAREILLELLDQNQEYSQPYWVARIYAALGDRDKVFEWLQKAVEDRSEFLCQPTYGFGGLWLDEAWDGLRDDPRFQNIKAATGLKWPQDL